MKQMVEKETRGKNTLDLFIADRPSLVQKVTTGPGLSDHHTVIVDHQLQANIKKRTPYKFWKYKMADWTKVCKEVNDVSQEYLNTAPRRNTVQEN